MDIFASGSGVLELSPDLAPVVETRVHDHGGDSGEGEPVGQGVGHGDVHWRVGFVFALDEVEVLVDNAGDVVR